MVKGWLEYLKTSYIGENNRMVNNLFFPSLNENKIQLLVLSVLWNYVQKGSLTDWSINQSINHTSIHLEFHMKSQ